jgi:hypothetical protein
MRASARDWTDVVFELFIEGAFEPLSAREVCRAIDRIAESPSLLHEIDAMETEERPRRLLALVLRDAASRGPGGAHRSGGDSEDDPATVVDCRPATLSSGDTGV